MYGQVHANRVLYRDAPQPRHRYRQIAVVEGEQFELRIYTGNVIQTNPFLAPNEGAEIYFHPTLEAALADLDRECQEVIAAGWTRYQTTFE